MRGREQGSEQAGREHRETRARPAARESKAQGHTREDREDIAQRARRREQESEESRAQGRSRARTEQQRAHLMSSTRKMLHEFTLICDKVVESKDTTKEESEGRAASLSQWTA